MLANYLVADVYEKTIDRESAHEMIAAIEAKHAAAQEAPPREKNNQALWKIFSLVQKAPEVAIVKVYLNR